MVQSTLGPASTVPIEPIQAATRRKLSICCSRHDHCLGPRATHRNHLHALARLIRQVWEIQDDPACFDAKKMMSRSLRPFADGAHSEKIDMAGDDLQHVPMVVEQTRNATIENDPLGAGEQPELSRSCRREPLQQCVDCSFQRHQLGIGPVQHHQLLMRAPFGNSALVQHDDLIAIANRAQAMRNDYAGTAPTS